MSLKIGDSVVTTISHGQIGTVVEIVTTNGQTKVKVFFEALNTYSCIHCDFVTIVSPTKLKVGQVVIHPVQKTKCTITWIGYKNNRSYLLVELLTSDKKRIQLAANCFE